MATTIKPDDLYATARHLCVDLAAEPFLLPLIRQAVATPLPPQWSETHDSDGNIVYRNELTGTLHETHPADAYFLTQIHELRCYHEEHEGTSETQSSSAWMEFTDTRGTHDTAYYYDFVSQITQQHRPHEPLAGSDRSTLATLDSAAATKLFAHATRLHKSPSMKQLETLEILCFTSWWAESRLAGSKKIYLQLYFSIPTRHVQLALDEADDVFTISHIVGPTGRVVSAWDLHVGARLQILGRWTTLMQPSLLTRQWLALHEKHFLTMKRELENELLKYDLHSSHRRTPLPTQSQCVDTRKTASGMSLRKLISEIDALKMRLATYRPDVARRFVIPYDADDDAAYPHQI